MKSSFYFLIIMNGLSCFTWQSHAAQMIRVTELQGHPNSQAQSEILENILQPVLTNPLNLSFMTPPIFPWLLQFQTSLLPIQQVALKNHITLSFF